MAFNTSSTKDTLCEFKSLADLLDSGNVIVFKGVEIGGQLNDKLNSCTVGKQTLCDANFNCLYTQNFITPMFVTLYRDNVRGAGYWLYQLDEFFTQDKKWHRRIGAAHLVNDNELGVNEIDAEGSISFDTGKKKVRLFRQRSVSTPSKIPFIQACNVSLSSVEERNETVACKC